MKKYAKIAALLMAFVLVIAGTVGVTMALLTDTKTVTNTFTIGKVAITLDETKGDGAKLVPGTTIDKDPKVTVIADSEACYVFVKIEKSADIADKINTTEDIVNYTIATGWTLFAEGVYYRTVDASDSNQEFGVFANDQVTVHADATADMLTDAKKYTLTITAYACQKENVDDAATAWAALESAYRA